MANVVSGVRVVYSFYSVVVLILVPREEHKSLSGKADVASSTWIRSKSTCMLSISLDIGSIAAADGRRVFGSSIERVEKLASPTSSHVVPDGSCVYYQSYWPPRTGLNLGTHDQSVQKYVEDVRYERTPISQIKR